MRVNMDQRDTTSTRTPFTNIRFMGRVRHTCSGQCVSLSILAGQLGQFMDTWGADPAPEPKAGGDKALKMLLHSGKVVDAEEVAACETAAAEEETEPVNEADFVTVLGSKQSDLKSGGNASKPHLFFNREVYQELDKLGLTILPSSPGFGLSCHNASHQWHGRFGEKHFAPSWGEQIRSEMKSLLLVLIQIWSWFLETSPDDTNAKEHHEKLRAFSATVPK